MSFSLCASPAVAAAALTTLEAAPRRAPRRDSPPPPPPPPAAVVVAVVVAVVAAGCGRALLFGAERGDARIRRREKRGDLHEERLHVAVGRLPVDEHLHA